MKITLPSFRDQEAIARILGALDDKIELNRQMNRTLEEMAQTLFKSWFVDFDPVVAKADGRKPYGLSEELAALFPDSFQESELGPIPKGWRVRPLDKIAHFLNGLALAKFPPQGDHSLPVIKIAQLRAGSPDGPDRASLEINPKYVIDDGDIIFSWSGSLLVKIWFGGKGALNQHLFKVTSETFPNWFYYQWLLIHLEEFQGIAADKATTMGHIRRHHLTEAPVVVPSSKIIEKASSVFSPLLQQFSENSKEMKLLESLRSSLLPLLFSGELQLRQAEKLVEEVA
ncbi:MAG: restriction endonuclease subunit S [Magnetococcales bacterium]|nr:restriction endonuclease subunit S [Magnetococcales bacterium]